MGEVKYRCGSAEVLRRECSAGEIAIKALRPRNLSLEAMRKVSYRWFACVIAPIG